MNIVEQKERVDYHLDRSKSARFYLSDYINGINLGIVDCFRDRTENEKIIKPYTFESNEQVITELYSLIVDNFTLTPAGNMLPWPSDYRWFGNLYATVDGVTKICHPLEMKREGVVNDDPFNAPTTTHFYYQEINNKFQIFHGGTALQAGILKYLKYPINTSLGQESDQIDNTGTLAINTDYIVYDNAVFNAVNYPPGAVFNSGLTTVLTSGIVIPRSVTIDCDMPPEIQDEICERAADTMMVKAGILDKSKFMKEKINED